MGGGNQNRDQDQNRDQIREGHHHQQPRHQQVIVVPEISGNKLKTSDSFKMFDVIADVKNSHKNRDELNKIFFY